MKKWAKYLLTAVLFFAVITPLSASAAGSGEAEFSETDNSSTTLSLIVEDSIAQDMTSLRLQLLVEVTDGAMVPIAENGGSQFTFDPAITSDVKKWAVDKNDGKYVINIIISGTESIFENGESIPASGEHQVAKKKITIGTLTLSPVEGNIFSAKVGLMPKEDPNAFSGAAADGSEVIDEGDQEFDSTPVLEYVEDNGIQADELRMTNANTVTLSGGKVETEPDSEEESQRQSEEESERKAESERQSEEQRQSELQKQSEEESERKAESERQSELQKQSEEESEKKAESEKQSESQRKAESERQSELQKQSELEVKEKAESESESQRQSELEAKEKAESESQKQSELESEEESQRQSELEAKEKAESESQKQSELESEEESQRQSELESERQSEAESQEQSELKSEKRPEIQPGTESEKQPETQPGTESEKQPETQPGTEEQSESETQTEIQPGTESETQPETQPGTESEEQTETTQPGSGSETNPGGDQSQTDLIQPDTGDSGNNARPQEEEKPPVVVPPQETVPFDEKTAPKLQLSSPLAGSSRVRLEWTEVQGADGYEILQVKASGETKLIAEVSAADGTTYEKDFSYDKKYKFKIRAFRLNAKNEKIYGKNGAVKNVRTPEKELGKPGSVNVHADLGSREITITWKSVKNADGYQIFMRTGEDGTFELARTINDGKTTTCTVTKKYAETYTIRVAAFQKDKKGTPEAFGNYSSEKSVTTAPAKVGSTVLKSKKEGQARITWPKVSKADGYQIFRSTSEDGKYIRIKNITKKGNVAYTDKKVKSGETYYYKVRAYVATADGKNVFGDYSAPKAVKVK